MAGKVTVITGPMRSSKTLDAIIKAFEAEAGGKNVLAFHPNISSRWSENEIVTRLQIRTTGGTHKVSYPSTPVCTSLDGFLRNLPLGLDLVIFDDAQFFSANIVSIVRRLRDMNIDVLISGLDMDCFQQPFGPMPMLLAIADEVIKKPAICEDCFKPAQATYRVVERDEQIVVGDEEYISLCFDCWRVRKKEDDSGFRLTFKDNEEEE